MPKKFVGENSKAVVAKARKAQAKTQEDAIKQKQKEDEEWRDDHKQVLKKQQKLEDLEKKKQEQLNKKAEAKALLEKEMDSIKTQGKQPLAKITRAQIVAETEKRNQMAKQIVKPENAKTHADKPIEENINRYNIGGEVAETIEEAISVLSLKEEDVDRHPEKRMKAAYTAFEEFNMPIIKDENPSLKLSQLKQILFKQWQKSPENPLNRKL